MSSMMIQTQLSEDAMALYRYMEKHYIEKGYMYSGSIGGYGILHEAKLSDWDRANTAIRELIEAEKIEVRKCKAFSIELSVDVRKKLIIEHKLNELWEKTGSCFYPNAEHGEVCKVLTPFERLRLEYPN